MTRANVTVERASRFGSTEGYVLAAPVHYSGGLGLLDRSGCFLWPPTLSETVIFTTRAAATGAKTALLRNWEAERLADTIVADHEFEAATVRAQRLLETIGKLTVKQRKRVTHALAHGLMALASPSPD